MSGRAPDRSAERTAALVLGRCRPDPVEVGEAVTALRAAGATTVTVVTYDDVDLGATADGGAAGGDEVGGRAGPVARVLVVGRGPQVGRARGSAPARVARLVLRTVLRRTAAALLARAVLGRPDVVEVLGAADVVCAGDPDAIETVWRVARRAPGPAAVNGVPAAVRALRARG